MSSSGVDTGALASGDATIAGDVETRRTTGGDTGPELALAPGSLVGRYVVLARLGAGGMGVVYLAYDPELDRKVAIKLLRSSIGDGAAARALVLGEAQALAKLTHPNVVGVYDVGTIGERVWLAMEFVAGRTLAAWRREAVRSWRETLDVMIAAGRGLAAAHAAGLVHRDFKPDNVMVAADGRVLVMDFGIARSVARAEPAPRPDEDGSSLPPGAETVRAGLSGTPSYMAPEQHQGRGADARLDQFGFCVTLWEALFGARPFTGENVTQIVLAVTRGELNPPPLGASVPRWLRRAAERGLRTDPAARWPSMDALLAELDRRRARTRTVRVLVAAASAVLAIAAVEGGRRVLEARRVAACDDEAAAIAALWPGADGATRAQLDEVFAATGVGYAQDGAARVHPWLDDWTARWQEARAAECVAATDGREGDHAEAMACLDERREALAAALDTFSRADADVVRRAVFAAAALPSPEPCRDELARARAQPPEGPVRERAHELRRELEHIRSLRAAGHYAEARDRSVGLVAAAEELGWAPLVAQARLEGGRAQDRAGDLAAAEALLQSASFAALAAGNDTIAADAAIALISIVGVKRGRHDDGALWGLQADALLERLGESDGLRRATLELNLGTLSRARARYDEALDHLARAMKLREAALGPDHPEVIAVLNNLANVHFDRGDYDEAARLHERVLATWERTLGPDHPDTALSMSNLANVDFALGRLDRAQELYARSLVLRERALGARHPEVAQSLNNLGAVASAREDYAAAADYLGRALAIREETLGPDHPDVAQGLANLGHVYASLGQLERARELGERARAIQERVLGPDHPDLARTLTGLGNGWLLGGDPAEADRSCSRAQAVLERALGRDHPDALQAALCVAQARLAAGLAMRAKKPSR